MINEFKLVLQKHIKGEAKSGEVTDLLQKLLKKHPQLAGPMENQINQLAQDGKITADTRDAVLRITTEFTNISESADKTVLTDAVTVTEMASGQDITDATDVTDATEVSATTSVQQPDATLTESDATLVNTDNTDTNTSATATDDGFALDLDATGGKPAQTSPTMGPDGIPVMTYGDEAINVGSILRNRFELVAKLGEGGMGAVYLATDKIKEEAQDKNPRIAVKVLNETFKQFRESFIALQRESSKQQRLAHPNIATVFDFDRDYTYGTVFMTMEYLEGEPLDKYIRRLPGEGLSYEEARPVIEGMCHGLAYAHHHQLVHSDFKPANTFLNKDGVVKLLDFGIARAAKPKDAPEGSAKENTLFDPGTLSALTPAYASAEMLEGETPEPPDDIYALACVCYQLLSGRHPFNKMPANHARDGGLTPAPIKKLKRRQMKGLVRGLSFDRNNRPQTVEEFLDEITPKKPILAYSLTAAVVILTIIGVLAKDAFEDHLREQQNQEMIAAITEAGAARQSQAVKQSLTTLETFEADSQTRIKADPDVQNAIVGYFSRRIDEQIDKTKQRYNYPQAFSILEEARRFYPDSGTLDSKEEELNSRKSEELESQRDLYTRFLKIGPWLSTEGTSNDIPDVINIIRRIDPGNPLLTDPRLVGSYITEARGSQQENNHERAKLLLGQAAEYTEDKTDIINAEDELSFARHSYLNQQELENLIPQVTGARPEAGIQQALSVRDELIFMRLISPENEVLTGATEALTDLLVTAADESSELSSTEQAFLSLSPALSAEQQETIRSRLSDSWQKVGGVTAELSALRQTTADELQAELNALASENEFTHEWTQSLRDIALRLEAMLGSNHIETQRAKRGLATQHIEQAITMSEGGRLAQGEILIAYARQFDASVPGLKDAEDFIVKALREQEIERLEKERLAIISALKQDTIAKAKSEKVEDAVRFLDLLRVYLLPDDEFLTVEGPGEIGKAYASLALRAKRQADAMEKDYTGQRDAYIAALNQINTGLEVAPNSPELADARAQIEYSQTVAEVRNTFSTSQAIELAELQSKLSDLRAFDRAQYERLQTEFSEAVTSRISTMEMYDPESAKAYLEAARQLPINQTLLSRIRIAVVAPSRYAVELEEAIKASMLSKAGGVFARAREEESDHPDIKRLRTALANKINEANDTYKEYQVALRNNDTEGAKALIARALRIWRDNPEFQSASKSIKISIIASKKICQTRLAGYGKQSRGRCYDMVSVEDKGPIMIVLPPGAGHNQPFAFSKYEVSVADFNHYCQKTKKCQPNNSNPRLPVTGITLQQANDYAEWLSKTTGAKYRLPTVEEWKFAAEAGGDQPKGKIYNCTLRLGQNIIKGTGLEDVNSGKQNGWGLVNYIGNAQEWVTSASGVRARGGAYNDAMQDCTVDLEKPHDGKADAYTTFRLVRDVI